MQVDILNNIVACLPNNLDIVGIEWGSATANIGVELVACIWLIGDVAVGWSIAIVDVGSLENGYIYRYSNLRAIRGIATERYCS